MIRTIVLILAVLNVLTILGRWLASSRRGNILDAEDHRLDMFSEFWHQEHEDIQVLRLPTKPEIETCEATCVSRKCLEV